MPIWASCSGRGIQPRSSGVTAWQIRPTRRPGCIRPSARCRGPGHRHPEKEYLKLKDEFAENLIRVWGDYAPNINWDTIIG